MNLLVHACCGPCSIESTRALREEGNSIVLYYSNPNIHPKEEYAHRLETIKEWASGEGLELVEGLYDPDSWEARAGVFEWDRARRCRQCYLIRFERAAKYARVHGFEGISTTLTISPYQFTDEIGRCLESCAKAEGVKSEFRDFRDLYRSTTNKAREMGLYRQNFCGCHYSAIEAERERAERKAARKAAKMSRQAV